MDKNEEQLHDWQEEKVKADKRLLNIELVLAGITIFSFVIILLGAVYAITTLHLYTLPIIAIVVDVAMLIIGITACYYIEQKAGYYECTKCHHKYEPTLKQSCFAMHIGRTKYLKCPQCKQRSWHKKVLK